MPRGYRLVILAIAGWLVLCGAQPPNKQSQRAADAQKTTSQLQASSPPFNAYSGYDPDPCYHAKDHDSADLCAQWRAAIAAEKAAHESRRATFWAIIATFLSAATVIGLIVTIRQTNGALGEARRGNRIAMKANARTTRQTIAGAADTADSIAIARQNTLAAERSVAVTERAAEETISLTRKRIRAYMVVKSVKVLDMALGHSPKAEVVVVNAGDTPAIKFSMENQIMYTTCSFDMFESLSPVERMPYQSKTVLPKNQPINNVAYIKAVMSAEYIDLFLTNKSMILVRGFMEYDDIFGEPHRTNFLYHYNAQAVASGIDAMISHLGNEMT